MRKFFIALLTVISLGMATQTAQAVQPLYQTDPRWATYPYGDDGTMTLEENGCAVVVLAMVESGLSGCFVSPIEMAEWAGNDYYLTGSGTSWSIFEEYGYAYGREVYNIGNDMSRALNNLPLMSVKPPAQARSGSWGI